MYTFFWRQKCKPYRGMTFFVHLVPFSVILFVTAIYLSLRGSDRSPVLKIDHACIPRETKLNSPVVSTSEIETPLNDWTLLTCTSKY